MMMPNIVKLIIALISIAAVSILLCAVNLNKKNRKKQSGLTIFAFIFSVAGSIAVLLDKDEILSIYNADQDGANEDILLLNLTVAVAYCLIKMIYCLIMKKASKDGQGEKEHVEGSFYSYDANYSQWFLVGKWVNVRALFKSFVVVETIVFGAFLGMTWIGGPKSSVWMFIFPIIALISTAEIYNYLNGYTKKEYDHQIYGEDAHSQKISNFYRIRDIYEKMFPHVLLSANTAADYMSRPGVIDTLKNIDKSDDAVDKITAQFFMQYEDRETYDIDAIEATRQMMKGKNVVFFNPFYRELGKYLILPIINALLSDKKVLVVLGRNSTKEDVKDWLNETIREYNHIRSLWRAEELSDRNPNCEIGILNYSQLYNINVIDANREFLKDTGFVMILEPSIIINTGQVGLSMIAEEVSDETAPTYCVIDRATDGMIDTLSHLLRTEFTNAVAAPVPKCIYSGMSWDADGDYLRQEMFDKETKFLGNGTELAAVAVKNQIPKVSWYGEKKAPIKDIKWIAGQHYHIISKYMNVPAQQQGIYDKIDFISNLWHVSGRREEYIIAEDEFCNMFSTMRTYLSRGEAQTFVNVLSENYLFRDYMRCNPLLFMSNPHAIPSIVPDYAKTERNLLIKLLFNMASGPVKSSEIEKELNLLDVKYESVLGALSDLLKKYTTADETIFTIKTVDDVQRGSNLEVEDTYEISKVVFNEQFAESLKTAYYIIEDEERSVNKIDARMYGHVTQNTLPGQFVTYDGKYYRVKSVSADGGVILRRASDLYDGRKYYKQVRKYHLEKPDGDDIVNLYNVMDIEIAEICRNIKVQTTGYLEMKSNNDLRSARLIDFTNDSDLHEKYNREYRNKRVLRIKLPETDDKIRFTICLLLSEAFRTIFPDSWQYIAVTTARPQDIEGMLNYTVYDLEGDYNEEYIYLIEDSDMDMGLLGAVEKNWMRFMEIIADYLNWHFEKMKEAPQKDPVVGKAVELPEDRKRDSLRKRMLQRIRQLFGVKKEENIEVPAVETAEEAKPEEQQTIQENEAENVYDLTDADETAEGTVGFSVADDGEASTYSLEEAEPEEAVLEEQQQNILDDVEGDGTVPAENEEDEFMPDVEENPDIVAIDGTDIFDNEGTPEEELYLEESFRDLGIAHIEKTRYQKECFLKFGFEEIDSRLHIEELRKYLTVRGWSNNALKEARTREVMTKNYLDFDAVNHCDFCGKPLSGVSYEKITDGRIRCNECASSAIDSSEEFVELFNSVIGTMESFFNIEYKVAVAAKMTDAKTIAKGAGCVFVPSTETAARVLGFAQRKKGNYSLFVENGSPRLATIDTVVHEMTHIWQYLNWDDKAITELYGKDRNRDIVYEGMAMWAAIQYLYMIGENSYAAQQELVAERRNDVYGEGFRLYRDKYPLIKDSSIIKISPFSTFPPL